MGSGVEVRIAVIGRGRGRVHLDICALGWESDVAAVHAAAAHARSSDEWLIAGGEPALWAMLPEAIEALAGAGLRAGVVSDGWALADERVTRSLAGRGLHDAVIQLHAPNADAHDWITGVAGSARRAIAAVRVCRDAGLRVAGEIWLTKPGAALLPETVALFMRLGVRTVTVRRLGAHQVVASDVLALMSPLIPAIRSLSAAARLARNAGGTLFAAGLPACLIQRVADLRARDEQLLGFANEVIGCDRCAGRIPCAGAPADYLAHFGSLELGIMQRSIGARA